MRVHVRVSVVYSLLTPSPSFGQVGRRFLKKTFFFKFIFGWAGPSLLWGFFSGCREWGLLSSCGARASHCGGPSCCRARALGCAGFIGAGRELSSCGSRALEHRLNSYGAWAQLLHGMWDLPGWGIKPTPPALAGRFFTPEPPGKHPDGRRNDLPRTTQVLTVRSQTVNVSCLVKCSSNSWPCPLYDGRSSSLCGTLLNWSPLLICV